MVAKTNQAARLSVLSACAISLLQRGSRQEQQTQRVFNALAEFLGEDPVLIEAQQGVYPGRFGGRCAGCGGYIDEGGMCNCGADHWDQTPGPFSKTVAIKMSPQEQQKSLIVLAAKAIGLEQQGTKSEQEVSTLLKQLQNYKQCNCSVPTCDHCGSLSLR